MSDAAVYELSQKILGLQEQLNGLKTPSLAFSTIEAGAVTVVDEYDSLRGSVGVQFDGSVLAQELNGPPPLTPSTPLVEGAPGAAKVRWDGYWADGDIVPSNFTRVEIHIQQDAEPVGDVASTIYGTFETPRGGEQSFTLAAGTYYVAFVARNLSGARGPRSEVAQVVVEEIVADTSQLEADIAAANATAADAKTTAEAVQAGVATIPDDIATAKQEAIDTAALTAQEKADAAEAAAKTAAALDAQAKADAAESAATAFAAADAQTKADAAKADAEAAAKAYSDTVASGAQQAAIDAAAADAKTKADAAEAAAKTAAALDAQAKADAAEAAAKAAAALDAQTKADAARDAAIAAAATDAQNKASAAQQAAISAAASDATTKADAARQAAIDAAALTAQDKADLAEAAALADAKTYADTKKAEAISAAASDAQAAYDGTKTLVSGWVVAGKTTIAGGKIETDSITSLQIAADSITSSELKAGAVIAGKLAADSVLAANIKAGEVVAGKLAAGAVIAGTIAANAVTTASLAAGAVTSAKILAGNVTATEIATDAITAVKIAAGAVVAGKLAADSVLTTNLVADAVIATKLAADAVLARNIKAGEVVAGKLAAGAVIAGNIAANAVTAGTIAAGAVKAGTIEALAVTSAELAANAVTAGKIKAGEVVAGKLAAGAVVAGNIAANAVTASAIAADAIDGKTITGATIRTAATGVRWELGDRADAMWGTVRSLRAFSGRADEVDPAQIVSSDGGGIQIRGPELTDSNYFPSLTVGAFLPPGVGDTVPPGGSLGGQARTIHFTAVAPTDVDTDIKFNASKTPTSGSYTESRLALNGTGAVTLDGTSIAVTGSAAVTVNGSSVRVANVGGVGTLVDSSGNLLLDRALVLGNTASTSQQIYYHRIKGTDGAAYEARNYMVPDSNGAAGYAHLFYKNGAEVQRLFIRPAYGIEMGPPGNRHLFGSTVTINGAMTTKDLTVNGAASFTQPPDLGVAPTNLTPAAPFAVRTGTYSFTVSPLGTSHVVINGQLQNNGATTGNGVTLVATNGLPAWARPSSPQNVALLDNTGAPAGKTPLAYISGSSITLYNVAIPANGIIGIAGIYAL